MTRFSGLCIGGPRDGETLVGDSRWQWVVVTCPVYVTLPGPTDALKHWEDTGHLTQFQYRYEMFRTGEGQEFVFWVPTNMKLEDVFPTIFAGYRPVRQGPYGRNYVIVDGEERELAPSRSFAEKQA